MENERPVIRVMCVDDDEDVARALQRRLTQIEGFEWVGWLPSADGLAQYAQRTKPDVVLVDVDMPGKDPFDAISDLAEVCPDARAVMFSGYLHVDLVDKAVEAGAWGYVTKSHSEERLVSAVREVAAGHVTFGSPSSPTRW